MRERFALLSLLFGVVAGTLVVAAACSSSSGPATTEGDASSVDASRPPCTPGESAPCLCPGGSFGTVVCSEAGTGYGACTGCPVDASTPPVEAGGIDASKPPVDSGVDAAAPDSASAPSLAMVFAHAAPGVPPVRLCFATPAPGQTPTVLPIPAIPDAPSSAPAAAQVGSFPAVAKGTPGFYPGTIAALPFTSDFSTYDLDVFAVLSSSIGNDVAADGGAGVGPDGGAEENCAALVGSAGQGTADSPPGRLVAGTDFFALPSIAAGTVGATGTYLLSLTGCLASAELGAGTCGAGGASNAQVGVARLDTTAVPSGSIGLQFAHRSSALEGTAFMSHAAASGGVIPVVVSGTTVTPLESSEAPVLFSASGAVPSTAAASAVDPTAAATRFGVLLVPAGGGTPNDTAYPGGDLFAMPFSLIASLSTWTASTVSGPGAFQTGSAFTVVLVGDPTAPAATLADGTTPNPSYDGRGLHFVAFPNVFAPKLN